MNKTFIDKLDFIYVKDHMILVTLSRGKDTWYIPGGKRESGETDHQALTREVKEELSVDLVQGSIKPYRVFEAPAHDNEGTFVRMTCYTANYQGQLAPNAEIAKLDFFSYSQKSLTSAVDHLIFDNLQHKQLIA